MVVHKSVNHRLKGALASFSVEKDDEISFFQKVSTCLGKKQQKLGTRCSPCSRRKIIDKADGVLFKGYSGSSRCNHNDSLLLLKCSLYKRGVLCTVNGEMLSYWKRQACLPTALLQRNHSISESLLLPFPKVQFSSLDEVMNEKRVVFCHLCWEQRREVYPFSFTFWQMFRVLRNCEVLKRSALTPFLRSLSSAPGFEYGIGSDG